MSPRPLRQYYDGVTVVVDDDLPLVEPWMRHRRRFLEELGALDDEQWLATTRCASWDARGVIAHLVTVDGFFSMGFRGAAARQAPTSFIKGFDPVTGTDSLIAPMLDLPPAEVLDRFVASTDAIVAAVQALDGDDWDAPCEAPFGHLPARLVLAHAFWDSWLHERDILEPLGLAPTVESDEALAALWYTLVVGGLQGGLLEDDALTGPGPEEPLDVTIVFDELPDDPLRIELDTGVRITRADRRADSGADRTVAAAGSAVELVEHATGRKPAFSHAALPSDLAAQLERAAQIL